MNEGDALEDGVELNDVELNDAAVPGMSLPTTFNRINFKCDYI